MSKDEIGFWMFVECTMACENNCLCSGGEYRSNIYVKNAKDTFCFCTFYDENFLPFTTS